MLGTVDSLDTSFAGPRNLVKKTLPTIPPPPPLFQKTFSWYSKREGKGCGRRKKPKVEKSTICLQNHVQHLFWHKVK
jgi:hypothetical protein